MAIATAQLAAASSLSSRAKYALTRSAAISRYSLSSASYFAPVSARKSRSSGLSVSRASRHVLQKIRFLPIRAAATEETTEDFSKQAEEVFNELKAKWDGIENKSSVAIYGSGALVLLWFSSTIVNTINTVPLLPKLMELIGLGYSAWFVYRYLLFQDNRKELAADIKELKSKITGAADEISK